MNVVFLLLKSHTGSVTAFTNYFVGRPWLQLITGGAFFVTYLVRQAGAKKNWILLLPGGSWILWGIWEWFIMRFSSDSDIRIDLLAIFPAVLILSVVSLILEFKKQSDSPD